MSLSEQIVFINHFTIMARTSKRKLLLFIGFSLIHSFLLLVGSRFARLVTFFFRSFFDSNSFLWFNLRWMRRWCDPLRLERRTFSLIRSLATESAWKDSYPGADSLKLLAIYPSEGLSIRGGSVATESAWKDSYPVTESAFWDSYPVVADSLKLKTFFLLSLSGPETRTRIKQCEFLW